ncbi:MAG: hypothetical protein AB8I08_39480 [Sandaracinaceae bacterium]
MTEEGDAWVDSVVNYLDLGTRGVAIAIDDAEIVRLGELVRGLVLYDATTRVHGTAESLREAEPGSVAVLLLRDADAGVLNLMRPVLKTRRLRLVLWAPEGRLGRLSKRAPDFFDWIHHAVDCPAGGVTRSSVLTLQGARKADLPVSSDLIGADLRRALERAFPGEAIARPEVDCERQFDRAVEVLSTLRGQLLVLPKYAGPPTSWALAMARCSGGVILPRAVAKGGWRLRRPIVLPADLSRGTNELTLRALTDWEDVRWDSAVFEGKQRLSKDLVRIASAQDATGFALESGLARSMPEMAARLMSRGQRSAFLRSEIQADPVDLDPWSELISLERGALLDSLPHPDVPAAIRVESLLWREETSAWSELADIAASLGYPHVALAWDRRTTRSVRSMARRAEQALLGESRAEWPATIAALEDDYSGTDWWKAHAARERLEAGAIESAISLARETSLAPLDDATLCVITGTWHLALERVSQARMPLEPLEGTGLGLVCWALDAQLEWRRLVGGAPNEVVVNWQALFPQAVLRRPLAEARSRTSRLAHILVAMREGRYEDVVWQTRHTRSSLQEHWQDGLFSLLQGQALARLGQALRAIDHLRISASIVRRTTGNEAHPWALMADVERHFLEVVHANAHRGSLDRAVDTLEQAVWPEHRDVKAARALQARAKPAT